MISMLPDDDTVVKLCWVPAQVVWAEPMPESLIAARVLRSQWESLKYQAGETFVAVGTESVLAFSCTFETVRWTSVCAMFSIGYRMWHVIKYLFQLIRKSWVLRRLCICPFNSMMSILSERSVSRPTIFLFALPTTQYWLPSIQGVTCKEDLSPRKWLLMVRL
jgi:hypothetical protein